MSDELGVTMWCYLTLLPSFPLCSDVLSAKHFFRLFSWSASLECLSLVAPTSFSPLCMDVCSSRLPPKWITLRWKSLCQRECCSTTVIWLAFLKASLTRAQGSRATGKWLSPALSVLHLVIYLERVSKRLEERANRNTINKPYTRTSPE